MIMKETKNMPVTSAGVIIFREDSKEGTCILLLKTYGKFDLPKGKVDLEDATHKNLVGTESQIKNAAIREAYEECGFTIVDDVNAELPHDELVARLVYSNEVPIVCGNFNEKNNNIKNKLSYDIVRNGISNISDDSLSKLKKIVYLYVAETNCKTASIEKSPSGIYEHDGYVWEPTSTVLNSNLHSYLKAGIDKALQIYKTHTLIKETINKINI